MRRVPDPPHVVVQKLTDAFNKQDLETVGACLAANCVVANHGGETVQVGAPAVAAKYAEAFEERPKVRLSVLGRMSQGDKVVQHESVNRGMTTEDRRIAVYTVANQKVTRVEFIR